MADEQLRLVASLKDNATAGVRRIGKELKSVRVEPGMMQAQKWVRTFNDDVTNFRAQGARVGGILTSMGVGGLAAAGSIGALAAQFKQLADHVLDVKELGREIGVTTDELRAMTRAGQHFGLDPAKMEGALKRLAGMMPILRRGGNNELTEALARSPELIAKIRAEANDTGAVFRDVLGYINKLQNPQDRIKFFEQALGDGDLERLNSEGTGGFQKQLDAARKAVEPITKEAEAQAQALREAMLDFNASIEKLELKVAPAVFAGLTQSAKDFREAFGVIEKAYEWYQANKEHPIQAAANAAGDAINKQDEENRKNPPPGMIVNAPGVLADAIRIAKGQESLTGDRIAINKRYIAGEGVFAHPQSADEARQRLRAYQAEREALVGKGDVHSVARSDELEIAIKRMTRFADEMATPLDKLRDAMQGGARPAAVPDLSNAFHPDEDRLSRARASDVPDRSLDSFVLGALERPILHLNGTLRAAADRAKEDGIHPAAYHPNGLLGPAANSDPASIIEAGTKAGVIAAFRELSGLSGADGATARSGIMPASFGGGDGRGGGGGGSGGSGNFNFSGTGNGGWEKSGAGKAQVAAYIRHAAAAAGIDPETAVRVARSEGLNTYRGDYGTSFGAFQLHYGGSGIRGMNSRGLGDRFTAETGKDARDPTTWREQIDFAMKTARREGWGAWHGAQHVGIGNRQGIGTYSGPVPSVDDYDKGTASSGPMVGLERVGKLASEQCVALAAAAVKFRGSVTEWRKGPGAEDGTLKPGTPVATFLNRDGSQSGRYAGGGIGTPGAHLDHAGVFQRYITDEAGKRVGMTIAEQFKGSHGQHLRNYMFGRGWGEGNGSNYHAVLGPDGKPLGGSNNPMSDLRDAAQALRGAAGDQRIAARVVAKVPDWHDTTRPDLGAENRKASVQEHRLVGGVDAHIHVQDGQVRSARAAGNGHVRDARITVRTAPQRTATV